MNNIDRKTILLAEDEVLIAMAEEQMLADHGYAVITAHSGEEAVAAAEKNPGIDLVLMDIDLGSGMDGTAAAEIILRERDVPVVFLSSHTEPEIVEKTERITSYGYVVKNSGDTVLLASIRMAFRLFEANSLLKSRELHLMRASDELLRAQRAAHMGSWTWDIANRELLWSDGMYNIFGMEKGDFTGNLEDVIARAIHPDDRASVEASNRSVVEKSRPIPLEYRVIRPDGTVRRVWAEAGELVTDKSGKPSSLWGIVLDITERKQAEESLLASERHLRYIFDNAIVGMFISTPEGKFKYVNGAIAAIMGYGSRDELMRAVNETSIAEALYEDPARRPVLVEEVEKEQGNWKIFNNRYRRRDGKIIDAVLSFCETESPVTGEQLLYGFVQDVTERKSSEESMRVQRAAMTAAANGIIITDREGRIQWANPAFTGLTGYAPEEALGRNPRDLVKSGLQAPEFYARMWSTILSGEVWRGEIVNRKKDGSLYTEEMTITPVKDDRGDITHFIAVKQDISDRTRSEERMRLLIDMLDNAPSSITVHDRNGNFLFANRKTFELHGYGESEFMALNLRVIDVAESAALIETRVKLIEEKGEASFEVAHRRKDGSVFPLEVFVKSVDWEGTPAMLSIAADITDRKRAEEARGRHEARLGALLKLSRMNDATEKEIADFVLETIVSLTGSGIGFLGYIDEMETEMIVHAWSRETMKGCEVADTPLHFDLATSGIWAEAVRQRRTIIINDYGAELPGKKGLPPGHVPLARLISVPVTDGDKVVAVASVGNKTEDYDDSDVRQVTLLLDGMWKLQKRKEMERANEASIRLLGIINENRELDGMIAAICSFLREWTGCEAVGIRLREGDDYPYFETRGFPAEFVRLENSLCAHDLAGQLLRDDVGDPVIECMCGNVIRGRFDPSKPFFTRHGSFWSNCTTELLATTSEADRQASTRNRCNGMGYESVALIPLRTGGTTFGLLQVNDTRKERFTPAMIGVLERLCDSVAIAVSNRMLAREVRASEEKFRTIADYTADWEYWIGPDGGFVYVSPSCEVITGYSSEEFFREPDLLMTIIHPDDREKMEKHFNETRGETHPAENAGIDFRILRKNGGIAWIGHRCRPVYGRNGEWLGVRGSNRNITKRREMEESLRSGEETVRALMNASNESALMMEVDGTVLAMNEIAARRMGRRVEEMVGACVYDFLPEDVAASRRERVARVEEAKSPLRFEDERQGMVFENSIYPILDATGKVARLAVFALDITERKKAEKALLDSAEEKQALFRELQHRIKNTLAMITSLANLEADSADNPAVREALDNIRGRISSLSNLYSMLYASGETREVRLDQYIQAIGKSVMAAYVPEGSRINFDVRAAEASVNTKTASSLGLVINELLMNAFKYAFEGRSGGSVRVSLRRRDDGIEIVVADDGRGLPDDFSLEKSRGFGLRLAWMLVKQMKGSLVFERGAGTTFRMKVPLS
jgi:PAS domain S-box-containing protein